MKAKDIEDAYKFLKEYSGTNNQIRYFQYRVSKTGYSLQEFDITYILNNYDYEPFEVNKTIKISKDFGIKLRDKNELDFIPQKIKVTRVIGEMGNSFHCYIQYRKSVEPQLAYVNKNSILNPIKRKNIKKINVDFSKYNKTYNGDSFSVKELQKEGINFLLSNKQCILAHGMGCGKTVQAVIAAMESGCDKILIICPASLKSTWKREIMRFNDESEIKIVNGQKWDTGSKFTIINYDIIDNFYEVPMENVYEEVEIEKDVFIKIPKIVKTSSGKETIKQKKSTRRTSIQKCLNESQLFNTNFDCVIIDEAHKLSNNTSKRYMTISSFLKRQNPQFVFLLTGTPLTNKPINLYHILKLINAEVTQDYNYYVKHYCAGREMRLKSGKKIMLAGGASNLDELREAIKHVYNRRLLTEMTDMVNKTVITKYYDLTPKQMEIYNKLWNDYVEAQQNMGNDNSEEYQQLVEGILVRQFLAKEMIKNTKEIVDSKLEEDEKVIIVCTFQEEVDEFKNYYKDKAVVYNGKMTTKKKDTSEDEFMNNPKIKVFIANLQAASVGLTLTVSNFMVFNSYSWVAAENLQMQDRIYRLTQTRDVTCIYQLFNDSISKNMFDTVLKKEIMMKQTIASENEK